MVNAEAILLRGRLDVPYTVTFTVEYPGQKPVERWEGQLAWGNRLAGAALGEKEILFPKIESTEKAEAKG